jgi:hypothetical protein
MKDISNLYLNLIKNPFVPKIYRELCDYYQNANMENESKAFSNFLYLKFNELYNHSDNQQQ